MGSKRLPHKNVLPLGGVPMLVHTVRAALGSGVFDVVYVSTEDDEIARIAQNAGGVAHSRPQQLAGDLVSATDVCLELEASLLAVGRPHDAIVCLQPSSPLRNSDDVRAAWQQFLTRESDFLVSVTPIDPHYFHWALIDDPDGGGWHMYFRDRYLMERPLLPPVFRPNGAIKIGRCEMLRRLSNFFGPNLDIFEMPEERSVHVAEQADYEFSRYLLQAHAEEFTGSNK